MARRVLASYTAEASVDGDEDDVMSDSANQQPRTTGASREADDVSGASTSGEAAGPASDLGLLEALRRGDEEAYLSLVSMHYAAMLRLALMYVGSRAVAEEVIQETWVGVLQGLDRFEGRSSLKTWIFRILLNRARTRAQRENRTIPFSALVTTTEPFEPTVDPDVFRSAEEQHPGSWITPPAAWDSLPEERLLSLETRQQIDQALTTLPAAQREVITLRDIDGWSANEVCDYLDISEANQRVLLHRARARVRRALAGYLAAG
jgi:RNA polymerase sigma-70 factor (ECF subfamily)